MGCKSGRGDLVGAGYAGVEVLGGWDQVRREGRLIWAKISKTEPRGSVWLAKCEWAVNRVEGTPLGRGMLGLRC